MIRFSTKFATCCGCIEVQLSAATDGESPATSVVSGAHCLPTSRLNRAHTRHQPRSMRELLCVDAARPIGINSLELDRQATPPTLWRGLL